MHGYIGGESSCFGIRRLYAERGRNAMQPESLGSLEIRQMSQQDAEEVATWRYEGAYAFYDADADANDLALLLSDEVRENRYFSTFAEDGGLIGFFEFKQDGKTIELGLGLRPDDTGRGCGLSFVEAGIGIRTRPIPAPPVPARCGHLQRPRDLGLRARRVCGRAHV